MNNTWNANPIVYDLSSKKNADSSAGEKDKEAGWLLADTTVDEDVDGVEPITEDEVFDLIRSIKDPEHPHTLENLLVVSQGQVNITKDLVNVEFTPTVPHCGAATIIGLCIRVRLLRSLPDRFKVDITIKPGTHQSERAVNKQLNDKERVAAALENPNLLEVVEECLSLCTVHQ